jgi:oligoendopeptidase F
MIRRLSAKKTKVKKLPPRDRVKIEDRWDLSRLYESDSAWSRDLARLKKQISMYERFRGKLADSAENLAACLRFDSKFERLAERLGTYAFLRTAEDQTDNAAQRMLAQSQSVSRQGAEASAFIRPEILRIPSARIDQLLASRPLAHFRLLLQRLLRFKKHTLVDREEQLLAMQSEMAVCANKAFRQLLDSDMKFGFVTNEKGESVELTNATFSQFLQSPNRAVRRQAFEQYYAEFQAHQNTLAATLNGSIQKDVFYARARSYDSSLSQALFADNVPQSVYDSLIDTVHRHLPAVHRYYDVRRRKMRLRDIHHYDTYVPILSDLEIRRTWKQATSIVLEALAPLGSEYVSVLAAGLENRWCDRFPNQGKQSGAFSCGSYDADPYILMNYQPAVSREIFTLAHEAGHSMHSYFSAKHQSFEYYDYSIFVAEVASTFNESLLTHYLLERARDDYERAFLINQEIDDIRATIIRQTMFAEFEKITHEMAEANEPLTLQSFKSVYRKLLEQYFGAEFVLDDSLELECLRIPHFYRAFYVYKYATGLSAAITLSQRVIHGGQQELDDYLGFLRSGCSKDPLDLLRDAGVDMTSPEPVSTALIHFEKRIDELDELI